MKIKTEYVSVKTRDGEMEVYKAAPEISSGAPVLIVFQEAFGVNEHIQKVCQRFAHEGYLVLSPELYHRKGKHLQFGYTGPSEAMDLLKGLTQESLLMDLQALMEMISQLKDVDTNCISTVGYCVGGYISVLASMHFKFHANIAYYGGGMLKERPGFGIRPLAAKFAEIKNPLLLFFGSLDTSIPLADVHEMESLLKTAQIDFKSVVFEGAQHGFFCDARASFNKKCAEESWQMSLAFLKEHLTKVS